MREIEAERGRFVVIIHGAAKGTDWMAHLYAGPGNPNRPLELSFPPDWITEGRRAGPLRNQRMIDEGKPDLVIAFPGGRGTADMVRRARKARVEVIEVSI